MVAFALPAALLAAESITGGGSGGIPSGGPSLSMPAISGADGGNAHVTNTFTSGSFILGQGNSASTSGHTGLLVLGGIAAALVFWFRKK